MSEDCQVVLQGRKGLAGSLPFFFNPMNIELHEKIDNIPRVW
jgi:hypothetical protein